MVTRFATIGVASFAMLWACGAECQNARASLPDAPSAPVAIQTRPFRGFVEQMRPPLTTEGGFAAAHGAALRQEWLGVIRTKNPAMNDMDPEGIFHKYLYPTSTRPAPGHLSEREGSLMARATHAASHMIMTRDDSGKIRLNTPYLLRTLTYVAKDTASTPYWRRSPGEPVSDFGATVGDDAGMNVLHEFAPGIQQLMKSHAPKFVAKIAQRVGHK
jgi:hypothetical protein